MKSDAASRNVRLFYWFNFFCDFRLLAAVAVIYFAHLTGSYALAMSIFSLTFIAQTACEVPTGVFSDRVGRKVISAFGIFGSIKSKAKPRPHPRSSSLISEFVGGH